MLRWLKRIFRREHKTTADSGQAEVKPVDAAAFVNATQSAEFYDKNYFDGPKDVAQESGYAGYTPNEPGIKPAIRIATTYFDSQRILDVGCAKGYVVQGLRRKGRDAWGIDFSRYAIETAPANVRPYVAVGDALDIQFPADDFDLVICNEVLEHLTPERALQAISELYRVTSDMVWITTPSMGINDFGPPDGWPQGKIRETALPRYLANRDFPDPALLEDLMVDKRGYPIHGHLIAASYRWWAERFTELGFVRRGDIERQINVNEKIVRDGQWSSYVLSKPDLPEFTEQRWKAQQAALAQADAWDFTFNMETNAAPVVDSHSGELVLLDGSRVTLPPGRYEVMFNVEVRGHELADNPWTEVAVFDVCSSERQRIHALRTLRCKDVKGTISDRVALSFVSEGESDFEFRVRKGRDSDYIQLELAEPVVRGVKRL